MHFVADLALRAVAAVVLGYALADQLPALLGYTLLTLFLLQLGRVGCSAGPLAAAAVLRDGPRLGSNPTSPEEPPMGPECLPRSLDDP